MYRYLFLIARQQLNKHTDIHGIHIWYKHDDTCHFVQANSARHTTDRPYITLQKHTQLSGMQSVTAGGHPCKWRQKIESDANVINMF